MGLPELFGRKKKDLFSSIVDKIKLKAVSWSSGFLSSIGKLTMLKAVLSAIPSFPMTCFQLPVGLCDMIHSALTRFWWDSNMGKKKMCWLAWDKLTKPKGLGGLGFKDIQTFNTALLAKLPWRMLTNPDCLLSRVLLGKYCHKHSLLKVQPTKGASHGWTGILAGRDLLLPQLGRAGGKGTEIKVWLESWISTSSFCISYGPLKEGDSDLYVSDLINRGTCEWNRELVNNILPDFARKSLLLNLAKQGQETLIFGTLLSLVSTQQNQNLGHDIEPLPASFDWYRSVWTISTAPKLQLFLWKPIQGALPTGDNLRKRGMMQKTKCVHYGMIETTEHILLHCYFAKKVWSLSPLSAEFSTEWFISFTEALVTSANWTCLPPCGITGDLFSWVCWSIWTTRNRLMFENRPAVSWFTATKALTDARE